MSALWTLEPHCHMVTLLLGCFSGLVPFPAKHHATLSLTGTKTLGYVSRSCLDTDLYSSQIFSVRLDLFTQQGTVSFHNLDFFSKIPGLWVVWWPGGWMPFKPGGLSVVPGSKDGRRESTLRSHPLTSTCMLPLHIETCIERHTHTDHTYANNKDLKNWNNWAELCCYLQTSCRLGVA